MIRLPKNHREKYDRAKKKREELLMKGIDVPLFDLMLKEEESDKNFYKGFKL